MFTGPGRVAEMSWDVVSTLLPSGEVRGDLSEIIPCKREFTYLDSKKE